MPNSSRLAFWEVVGGEDKGGILVRKRYALTSELESARLAFGSIVSQIEKVGERLHYKLMKGSGPQSGWVSLRMNARVLVVPSNFAPEVEHDARTHNCCESDTDSCTDLPELLSSDMVDVEFALQSLQYTSSGYLKNLASNDEANHEHVASTEVVETSARENVHEMHCNRGIKTEVLARLEDESYCKQHNSGLSRRIDLHTKVASIGGSHDVVFRYYEISSNCPSPLFERASLEALVVGTQQNGALVLTTGDTDVAFIEVVTLLNRRGWMQSDHLAPVKTHGWHGDNMRSPLGGFDRFFQNHILAMLRMTLPAVQPHCSEAVSSFASRKVLEKQGQKAHLCYPPEPSGKALPLLIVLHAAGKNVTWMFEELIEELGHVHHANSESLILVPEAKDSTWDLVNNGTRHDIDFIQWGVNETRRMHCVDETRISIAGYAQGGSLALSLVLRNPNVFQASFAYEADFCIMEPHMLPANLHKPKLFLEYGSTHFTRTWALNFKQKWIFAGHHVEFRFVESEGCKITQTDFWRDVFKYWLTLQCRSCRLAVSECEETLDVEKLENVSDVVSEAESASELEMSGHIYTGGIFR